jgi:ABC-type multidrug transport system ATPase subunit
MCGRAPQAPPRAAAGLDSSNAAKVVDILAGLAAAGVGVVLTIHQPRPDVFRLMHRVLLLSGRGQVRLALVLFEPSSSH